jgi:hypothetical protein
VNEPQNGLGCPVKWVASFRHRLDVRFWRKRNDRVCCKLNCDYSSRSTPHLPTEGKFQHLPIPKAILLPVAPLAFLDETHFFTGYAAGGGVEYAWDPNIRFRME